MIDYRFYTGKKWSGWFDGCRCCCVYRRGAPIAVAVARIRIGDLATVSPDPDNIQCLVPIVKIERREG